MAVRKNTTAPANNENEAASPAELRSLAKDIASMIKSGALDAYMGMIDAAVESRIASVATPAPTAPTRTRATAPKVAPTTAQKTAPVARKKPSESASAPATKKTTEPVAGKIAQKLMPPKVEYKIGAAYMVNGGTKFHGAKVRVIEVIEGPTTKAKVEFREDYTGPDNRAHKTGKVLTIAAKMLMTPMAFGRANKS